MMSFPVFALLLLQQNPDERFVYDGVVQGGSVSDDGVVTRHCRLWTVHTRVFRWCHDQTIYMYAEAIPLPPPSREPSRTLYTFIMCIEKLLISLWVINWNEILFFVWFYIFEFLKHGVSGMCTGRIRFYFGLILCASNWIDSVKFKSNSYPTYLCIQIAFHLILTPICMKFSLFVL